MTRATVRCSRSTSGSVTRSVERRFGMSANSADQGRRLDVVLIKAGRTKLRYPAELLTDDGTRVVVRAPFAGAEPRDFGFVRFEPGDVFTEHYWRDRWYAVKELRDAEGVLKGWYCDIA